MYIYCPMNKNKRKIISCHVLVVRSCVFLSCPKLRPRWTFFNNNIATDGSVEQISKNSFHFQIIFAHNILYVINPLPPPPTSSYLPVQMLNSIHVMFDSMNFLTSPIPISVSMLNGVIHVDTNDKHLDSFARMTNK